jgi:hypothetical protein
MIATATRLKQTIDAARPRLLAIPEQQASEKPFHDKWSCKEILGHLLDSAANNRQRIVRMQGQADIGSFVYDQQQWVTAQHYQTEPWQPLVEFWYLYNAHLSHVIAHVDRDTLENLCDMGYSKPATLKFVIEDYVRHVEHHLGQIFGDAGPRERKKWTSREPD